MATKNPSLNQLIEKDVASHTTAQVTPIDDDLFEIMMAKRIQKAQAGPVTRNDLRAYMHNIRQAKK